MPRLVSFLLVILAVIVGILFAAPFFIPVETYKPQISALVKEQTGRELTIDGDISLSLLPRIAVSVSDVRFENASWASSPNMAQMEQLDIVLKLFPLLRGEIALDRFVLVRPEIDLAVNRQGIGNWVFDTAAQTAAPTRAESSGESAGAQISDIQLGEISLVDGLVRYSDARSGASYEASNINLGVSLPSLDDPLAIDGSLDWNGDTIDLTLAVAAPRALSSGGTSAIDLDISAPKLAANFAGSGGITPQLTLTGATSLDVPSIRALAAWAGQPLTPGGGLEALSLGGNVSVAGDIYKFSNATLMLDGMTGTGDLTVNAGGTRPKMTGTLALDRLDANVYLADSGEGSAGGSSGGGSSSGGSGGWSDAPIDLTGLKAIDADLKLGVGEILFQEMTIGKSALAMVLNAGRLTANLTELDLYEGAGTGRLVLDGSGSTPAVGANFNLTGVAAYPLLKDAIAFERLEGTGRIGFDVQTAGRSQKAMVNALSGSGSLSFADGAIRGINVAKLMRNVLSAATTGWQSGGTESTDFSELSGTFTISNGILSNSDLKLLSPLVRVTGKGKVDMPNQTLNYRVEPKLAATLEGQGGASDVKGVQVPIIISGSWSNPRFAPDLAAVIADPEGVKGVIDSVREDGGKGLLEGLLGGQQTSEEPAPDSTAEPEPQEEKASPEDLIRGLLNR
ncbi:MAG: AsmA family protein [Parvibaculaceae bacterium]